MPYGSCSRRLAVDTTSTLPVEMEADVRAFESLASSFLPERNQRRMRRIYATEAIDFVEETAERFHQLDEARTLQEAARREAGSCWPSSIAQDAKVRPTPSDSGSARQRLVWLAQGRSALPSANCEASAWSSRHSLPGSAFGAPNEP